MSIIIETRDLSKRYKDVQAVDKLNIKVRKGEVYGLLGPNGAGKTTTIKMLLGLTHPTEGDSLFDGRKVSEESVVIRKDVGYLPERVAFYDNLTPVQTLHFFCELQGADKSITEPFLKEVGLDDAMHRKVGTFSKGMVQLLGVAQAMIGGPPIYILDEPMGGLDPRWVKVVRDKIRMLNDKGATILFSSHILSEVQALCDRVSIINKGKLVAEDTVSNLSELMHIKPQLEITIVGLEGKVPPSVLEVEGVEDARAEGDNLIVTCDHELRLKIITVLKEKGFDIKDFKTIEPSLEEAFIKLISRDEGEV